MTNEVKYERPICSHCGSTEIRADAYAQWDEEAQDWSIVTTFDNTDCEDCGGECSVNWRSLPKSEIKKIERERAQHKTAMNELLALAEEGLRNRESDANDGVKGAQKAYNAGLAAIAEFRGGLKP